MGRQVARPIARPPVPTLPLASIRWDSYVEAGKADAAAHTRDRFGGDIQEARSALAGDA